MSDLNTLLRVEALVTGYRNRQVLNGISLAVGSGEIVAVIGHNGAGKSTLLKAIFGLLPVWHGRVLLDGSPMQPHRPRALLRAGVAYVPQGNRVFTTLTVEQNLGIGGIMLPSGPRLKAGIERALSLFPALKARLRQRAGTLSGGEKQMLALANALILSPRLLLLDEPSLGLAPPVVSDTLRRIQQLSRDSGVGVLMVEQRIREVLKIARYAYVLRNGQVSFDGPTETLNDTKLGDVYF